MDDRELQSCFEDCSLPFEQWTHRAHVRVAWCYLHQYSYTEALERIRSGIKAFNASNNVPEGPGQGYNETTTVAFVRLVYATMSSYDDTLATRDSEAFCDAHPQLMHKEVLRLFYSPTRSRNPDTKVLFVEPDLAQLPRIPIGDGAR